LGDIAAMLGIYFDHHRHIVEVGGAAQIIEVFQVERRVFADKFDVVVMAGMTDRFDKRRPRALYVGA
jgi:hypothetical protein